VPTNAKPVKSWPDDDEAFHNVTEHIHQVVSDLQIRRILAEADKHADVGRYKEALACYEQVLSLDEQNGEALFGRARILYNLEKIDESIEAFTLAEQKAPDAGDDLSYILKGNALSRREQYAESLVAYDQVLKIDPGFAAIHVLKAKILIKQ